MKPPSEFAQKKRQQDTHPPLGLSDWFKIPECDQVVRRHQVWSLLSWYHHEVYMPNRGLRGFFRRLWWRVQAWVHPKPHGRYRARMKLFSPWERIQIRIQLGQAQREQQGAADPAGLSEDGPRIVEA